ncbi:MAG: hypothetical protein FWG85_03630 [Bacteroidetes bacterium]|nr:hypothetical protein [Bacteroidota bacterium]
METLEVKVLNPQAKELLLNLEALNLITIEEKEYKLQKFIDSFRNKPDSDITFEEITEEVEIVRAERYAKRMQQNNN